MAAEGTVARTRPPAQRIAVVREMIVAKGRSEVCVNSQAGALMKQTPMRKACRVLFRIARDEAERRNSVGCWRRAWISRDMEAVAVTPNQIDSATGCRSKSSSASAPEQMMFATIIAGI